jgi:hypothetical protein
VLITVVSRLESENPDGEADPTLSSFGSAWLLITKSGRIWSEVNGKAIEQFLYFSNISELLINQQNSPEFWFGWFE